jgi:hypothetical protein
MPGQIPRLHDNPDLVLAADAEGRVARNRGLAVWQPVRLAQQVGDVSGPCLDPPRSALPVSTRPGSPARRRARRHVPRFVSSRPVVASARTDGLAGTREPRWWRARHCRARCPRPGSSRIVPDRRAVAGLARRSADAAAGRAGHCGTALFPVAQVRGVDGSPAGAACSATFTSSAFG